jgi:hypothetical protein
MSRSCCVVPTVPGSSVFLGHTDFRRQMARGGPPAAVVEARRVAVRDRAAGELPVLIGESLRAAIIEDAALIAAVAIIRR